MYKGAVFSNLHQLIHISTQKPILMNILSLQFPKYPFHLSKISCSYNKPPLKTLSSPKTIAPRDRIIDFGRFKGKMLGTIPSTYLKWVSKNLRAQDSEEWAKLADEVLEDPVYKDRIEWEFAEKLLNGEVLTSPVLKGHNSAVSELLEMSKRFGWDNEDKVAWSKIDYNLLGTSKGARIPRIGDTKTRDSLQSSYVAKKKKNEVKVSDKEVEERRKERRERRGKVGIGDNDKGTFGIGKSIRLKGNQEDNISTIEEDRVMNVQSPFPGRESLLRKVLNRTRV